MIYVMNIADTQGATVATIVFNLHRQGASVVRYRLGKADYPACEVWELIDKLAHVVESPDFDERSKRDLLQLERLLRDLDFDAP